MSLTIKIIEDNLPFKYCDLKDCLVSTKTFNGISLGDDKKLRIYFDEEDFHTIIYYYSNKGEEYIVFEGFIKDLSILKYLFSDLLKIELE